MIHWAWLLLALLIGEFFGLFTVGLCSINKLTQTNEPFQITRGCNICNGDDAPQDIDEAPTIYAEPVRHGQWVDPYDEGIVWFCTACKRYAISESPYCPDCGVKMDGGESDAT